MKKRSLVMILGFIALILLPLIETLAEEQAPKATIKIGAILGFTGFANVWSEQARRGIEMAVAEANSSGGVHGQHIEVIYEDSSSTPAGGVSAFNKLVNVNKVKVVVGDIISFITLPLIPLAQRKQVLLVTPSLFDTDMPIKSDFVYTTCPRKDSIRESVDGFFKANGDVRRVAVVCANNSWGLTYLDVWKESDKALGVEVADINCIDNYTTDMRAEILRAKAAKPDALIIAFGIDRALKIMDELKFYPKVLSTSDVAEAISTRGLQPNKAEGVFFNDWVTSEDFRRSFEERYEKAPIMEPQNSYEAMRSIVEALRSDAGNPNAGMRTVNYNGVSGRIDFTKDHFGNWASPSLMVVKEGKVVPVN